MNTIGTKQEVASFLGEQDAPTLAQVLLELAEDFAPVYERLERLRLRDDPAALSARFNQQLQRWESDDRFVAYKDAAAFGRELDGWVAQVQREVLPRFPGEAMALFAAFIELDRVVFERVDDDGGYVGGAFKLACRLWLTAAAATGLSGVEIESRASALRSTDNYGARSGLNRVVMSRNSRQIVLVHGAWGGAWIWRHVLPGLRAAGHEVHAVTLTGDGERAHLRHPGITLRTHIDDVVGLVTAAEMSQVVLVGHSYAGQVITGAADALPGRVKQLIYVDAMVPLPGEGWGSSHSPEVVAARQAAAAENGHALPPPDPAEFGLTGAERDWLLRRQVPHPFGPYREAMHFDAERWRQMPRAFVDCTSPAYPTIAAARRRVREQGDWALIEMPTGHCPMVSAPREFTDVLLSLLNQRE